MPDASGFSVSNLRYMKWFYQRYCGFLSSGQADFELSEIAQQPAVKSDKRSFAMENAQQVAVELFSVPWGHHMAILGKAKSAEEFVDWLSEANPNIWEGECSGDPAVYEDFLEFLSKQDCESLSVSQIAKLYFAQLDDH